ncbi:PfkB family carbohydrate kinase [Microbacterium sp.]|uniref:carbohydrate kinase family protein n=1 Tax=Microbacterium sp. TaxID=51671 RepID=UPI00333E5250
MPVAVLSHIVVDEVADAEGRSVGTSIGGAGAYAAVGAALAGPAGGTALVSGVGRDDRPLMTAWCAARGISAEGLFDVGEHSPRTRIQYFADGERIETPVHGLDHFHAHTPLPRHIPQGAAPLEGVYLFHDHDPAYWDEVSAFRRSFSGPLLWEISLDSCRPEHLDAVRGILREVDVLSINATEARMLTGEDDLAAALDRLGGGVVVLRRGEHGSLLSEGGRRHRIGTAPTPALDPTGGGNSYSGAFLAAYARSGDHVAAATVAAAAAAAVVAAPGAPEVDDALRTAVAAAAGRVPIVRG